jgi:Uncharacterised nucleotidyltransferase
VDQTNNFSGIDQSYRLLALCARAEGHPVFYDHLTRQIDQFTAWHKLPLHAELLGMAPLLWHHIHNSGIAIPSETKQTLKGLYLRHRLLNRSYTLALTEVTSLFEKNGIHALVLKGLALAYEYYPDPALRPLRDIDLLLKQQDILRGLRLLSEVGFSVRLPTSNLRHLHEELTADSPLRNGIRVHFELHPYNPRGRLNKGKSLDREFDVFDSPPDTLMIENNIVYVPAPMDNLRYLSNHLARHLIHANEGQPLQLKWVADIISLVEKNARLIDWAQLRKHNPEVLRRLEVFYSLTPLPERFAGLIPIKRIPPPCGINQYRKGWPENHFREWKKVGFLRFLWWTFTPPSDWWLLLHFGIGDRALRWYRQVVYRTRIPLLMLRVLIHETNLLRSILSGPDK